MTVNGKEVSGCVVPIEEGVKEYNVEVVMGK